MLPSAKIGVEDTADVKQQGTKGQKNEENKKTIGREAVFYCDVSCVF